MSGTACCLALCYTVLCNSPCCTLLSGLAGVCACVNIPFHLRFMSRMDNLLSQQTLHSTAAAKDERSNGRILSALAMQWTTMNYNRQHKWGCRFCTWIFGHGSRHVKTGYPKIECLDTSKISWYLQMAKSCGPTFNFDTHLSGVKDILKVGTHTPSSGLRPVTEGSWFQMVEWSWRCWMLKTGWMQCYLCIPFVVVLYILLMSIFIWGLDWTLDL